jgi:hypothetical protein
MGKITKAERVRVTAQVVQHLLSKFKAPSTSYSTAPKKKKNYKT